MEIIPAILPKDFNEVEEKTALLVGLAPTVQIDICDGKFVPSTTWPYKKHDENFDAIIREDRGMPNWEELDYEFDLMIKNPSEDEARQWLSAGAKRIVLHAESSEDLHPCMKVLNGLVEIGLALNIHTPVNIIEKIESHKDHISYIQLMGIDKIGFQGQAFDEKVVQRIKEVKEKYPQMIVQIDGGVNLETAAILKKAGADRLVAGSVLFASDNIVDTYRELKRI
jgi:ribulose-phosphate 3-epimerase